jgi:hypothetical protein
VHNLSVSLLIMMRNDSQAGYQPIPGSADVTDFRIYHPWGATRNGGG